MATRRAYTAEFKREALRLAEERGKRSAIARALGIHLRLLRRWAQELERKWRRRLSGQGHSSG